MPTPDNTDPPAVKKTSSTKRKAHTESLKWRTVDLESSLRAANDTITRLRQERSVLKRDNYLLKEQVAFHEAYNKRLGHYYYQAAITHFTDPELSIVFHPDAHRINKGAPSKAVYHGKARTAADIHACKQVNKIIRAASLHWLGLKPHKHNDDDGPEPDV